MIITRGYKTYDTGKWKITVDNGKQMLECPECHSRAFMDEYLTALGSAGMRFCPYCGTNLKTDPLQITFAEVIEGGFR